MKNKYLNYSKEDLIKEITKLSSRSKFGLTWEDQFEEHIEKLNSEVPYLTEIKNKEIYKKEKDFNYLIEGENLHALFILSFSHQEKFDLIYIDPPFNTKQKWMYNNKFVDENDTWRHSKWISFMHHRLLLARNLLKEDGVLICAIDHNEQEALGLLLEDVFPSYDRVCVTIVHNPGGIQGDNFSYTHEYAYFLIPKGKKLITKIEREQANEVPLRDWGGKESSRSSAKNCFYPIYLQKGKIIGFGDVCPKSFHPKSSNIKKKKGIIEVYPIDKNDVERKWRNARNSVENIKADLVAVKKKDIYEIVRLKKEYRYKTVWTDNKFNSNSYGSLLLNKLIKEKFPFPKSIYTVKECLNSVLKDKKESLVLDFFAGSGTTAHALMEMNKEDGGQRRFILCTNNENKIAERVTFERLKAISKGENGASHQFNLKYYRINYFENPNLDLNKKIFFEKLIDTICFKEGIFKIYLEKENIKVYVNQKYKKTLIFLFNNNKLEKIKDYFSKIDNLEKYFYIFSYGNEDDTWILNNCKNVKKIVNLPSSLISLQNKISEELNEFNPKKLPEEGN